TLDASDISLGKFTHTGTLFTTESYTAQADVRIPDGVSGNYYLLVKTNTDQKVFEFTFTDNNVGATAAPVAVSLTPSPDLQITTLNAPTALVPGQNLSVSWTIK